MGPHGTEPGRRLNSDLWALPAPTHGRTETQGPEHTAFPTPTMLSPPTMTATCSVCRLFFHRGIVDGRQSGPAPGRLCSWSPHTDSQVSGKINLLDSQQAMDEASWLPGLCGQITMIYHLLQSLPEPPSVYTCTCPLVLQCLYLSIYTIQYCLYLHLPLPSMVSRPLCLYILPLCLHPPLPVPCTVSIPLCLHSIPLHLCLHLPASCWSPLPDSVSPATPSTPISSWSMLMSHSTLCLHLNLVSIDVSAYTQFFEPPSPTHSSSITYISVSAFVLSLPAPSSVCASSYPASSGHSCRWIT